MKTIYTLEVDHDGWGETLFEGTRKESGEKAIICLKTKAVN